MLPIPEMTKLDVAFGNIKHLPPKEEIPKKFYDMDNPWHKFCSVWFYEGAPNGEVEFYDGVDPSKVMMAIRAILVSFEPKHERKIAGAAYLLSQWVRRIEWTSRSGERIVCD